MVARSCEWEMKVERLYAAAQTPRDQFLLTVLETLPMRLESLEGLQWKDIIPGQAREYSKRNRHEYI